VVRMEDSLEAPVPRKKPTAPKPCAVEGCQLQTLGEDPPFCVDHWIMVPIPVRLRMQKSKPDTAEWFSAATVAMVVIALEEDGHPEGYA
jgi:hypothetical protein